MVGRVLAALAFSAGGLLIAAEPPAATSAAAEKSPLKGIRIPGTEATISFGGFARVDFIQDFDAIGDPEEFKTNTIPIDGTPAADQGGQSSVSARATRFNVEFRSPTPTGAAFRAFVEGDFFGDKTTFRLRHAYGEYGRLLGGQTWTTFMDISARPPTLDFEGPDAEVFVRHALIRYTHPVSKHLTWAVAVEDPDPQFAIPGGFTGSQRASVADLPAYLRYQRERGHVQVAGIARQIRFDGEPGSPDLSEFGWGINATFKVRTFGKDEVMGQLMYGPGAGRYIESFSGQEADAVILPSGEMETLTAAGAVLGYARQWSEKLQSGLSLAVADLENDDALAPTAISRTEDARVNLIYRPWRLLEYGGELLWGRRENQDGSTGEALRFQFSITFNFS